MNFFQSLNVGVFGLTVAAILGGVARSPGSVEGLHPYLWLFVLFVFLLRLKMLLDDHKYFGSAKTKNSSFKIGFVVGAVSWLLWGFVAWSLPSPQTAYFLAGMAISVSTIWIAVVAARRGQGYREQYIWIVTNVIFIMLLWEIHRRHSPEKDWVTLTAMIGLLILVVADLVMSKSVPELEA